MGDEGGMFRKHIVASVAFLLSVLPLVLAVQAVAYTVCSSGCDSDNIQGAYDLTNLPGDEVLITDSREYLEHISMNKKGISIRSNSTVAPTIRWSGPDLNAISVSKDDTGISGVSIVYDLSDTNTSAVYATGARNFTLRNATISNVASNDDGRGVFMSQFSGARLHNINISTGGSGGGNYGIYLSQTNDTEVRGNIITANGADSNYGVYMSISRDADIRDSSIQASGTGGDNEGILVEIGSNVTISGNNISAYGDLESNIGIFFQSSSGRIDSNTVKTNGSSGNYGLRLQSSPFTVASDNDISTYGIHEENGQNYGISIDSSSGTVISGSTISTGSAAGGDNFGIWITMSSGVEISYCTIETSATATDYGLVLSLETNNNTVSHSKINATLAPDVRDENTATAENFLVNTTFNATDISKSSDSEGKITILGSVSAVSSTVSTVNNSIDIDQVNVTNSTLEIETNATVSGADITVAKHSQNPGPANVGVTALGKYLQIEVDSAISSSLAWALIKIYYTDAELASSGADEASLRIYHLDTGTDTWSAYDSPNGGVNQTANFVWANTTHFSTFGVFTFSPPSPAPASSPSGGGGGGGGGGSAVPVQPAAPQAPAVPAIPDVPSPTAPAQPTVPTSPAALPQPAGGPAAAAAPAAPPATNPITGFFAFAGNGTNALTGMLSAGGTDPNITLMAILGLVGGGGMVAWKRIISKRKAKFHHGHEAELAKKDSGGEDRDPPQAVEGVRPVEPTDGEEIRWTRKKDRDEAQAQVD